MTKRGIPVVTRESDDIFTRGNDLDIKNTDLVVGDFDWTRYAIQKLGKKLPNPPDYPECLKHLLNRKIWKTTAGEM